MQQEYKSYELVSKDIICLVLLQMGEVKAMKFKMGDQEYQWFRHSSVAEIMKLHHTCLKTFSLLMIQSL